MAAADPRIATLAEMREHAQRLGLAFAAEAERASDMARKLEVFEAFDRCFFSVRVAIALELRLERAVVARFGRESMSDREALADRDALSDRDPPERGEVERYTERDRDRETERASFPILIRTLERVAADAAALPGPEPAALPSLRELLAQVKAAPPTAAPAPSLRKRLAGSGASAAAAPAAQRRPASNVAEVLAARRATGPPRR
jgi:hypothetical protein